jgi:hypothetical protein
LADLIPNTSDNYLCLLCIEADVSDSKTAGDWEHVSSSTNASSRQETLGESVLKNQIHRAPAGIIPRCHLHRERAHQYISAIDSLKWVITPLDSAVKTVEQHGSLEAVLSVSQTPIVSGIARDEITEQRTPESVLNRLELVQPAIYIPDRGFVYEDEQSRATQLVGVSEYRGWLKELHRGVMERGLDIRLLPLAKGTSREHFERLKPTFDELGFESFAFYGGQNCGTAGNAITALSTSLHTAIAVLDPADVLLIGRHTPNDLSRFSSVVSAASVWGYNITDNWGSVDHADEWETTIRDSQHSLEPDRTQTEITAYGTSN